MRAALLAFGAVFLATASLSSALAAEEDDADDIVILAVQPRSPDVKPVMQAGSSFGTTRQAQSSRATDTSIDAKVAATKAAQPVKVAERS